MTETMSGGCQCGRVRYTAQAIDDEAYLCHCRMCQRASGGVSIAFKNFRRAQVTWDGAEPDLYASSAIARRGYCRECGTPLTFAYLDSDNLDLTVGSFDEPGFFRPTSHFGMESWHPAWLDTRDLPAMRSDEHAPLVQRWEKAGGRQDD